MPGAQWASARASMRLLPGPVFLLGYPRLRLHSASLPSTRGLPLRVYLNAASLEVEVNLEGEEQTVGGQFGFFFTTIPGSGRRLGENYHSSGCRLG